MLQEMSKEKAEDHLNVLPNKHFVKKRDGSKHGPKYIVVHCWPVKFNKSFIASFEVSERNPDVRRFNPRAAAEFLESMSLLFNPAPPSTGLLGRLCEVLCGGEAADGRWAGSENLRYAWKETWNDSTAIVGSTEQVVAYLRVRPALQRAMGIIRVLPYGFVTSITINGKLTTATKQFTMMSDGSQQVAYVKRGYETMACVKPLDLFNVDCTLGPPLEESAAARAPKEGLEPGDCSSSAVLAKHPMSATKSADIAVAVGPPPAAAPKAVAPKAAEAKAGSRKGSKALTA